MVGLALIALAAIIAIVGVVKDNSAKSDERSFWWGLSRTGMALLCLSVTGFILGIAKELQDAYAESQRSAQLTQQLADATKERDSARRELEVVQGKLDDIKTKVDDTEQVAAGIAGTLDEQRPQIGMLDHTADAKQVSNRLINWDPDTPSETKARFDNQYIPDWFYEAPWYRHAVINRDQSSQSLNARVGDRFVVGFKYDQPSQFRVRTFASYLAKYVNSRGEHSAGAIAILQVGKKYYPIWKADQEIEIEGADDGDLLNRTQPSRVFLLLPGDPSIEPKEGFPQIIVREK